MKIVCQPDVRCNRCQEQMRPIGSTGTQDVYQCETCRRMEFFRWQDRRGSVRKQTKDEPIEVFACSGEINEVG